MKTTRTFTLPLIFASNVVLTACGGGSDSSTNNNIGGTEGSNTVTLSASVVQQTVCNTTIPASTAELIVYDDNWAIKSRHKADASGKINASIPKSDYANISLIGTNGVGASRRVNIDTFTQHPVGDFGIYTIPGVSEQGCECQTTTVAVTSALGTIFFGAQLSGNNMNTPAYYNGVNSNVVQYENVEVCRIVNGEWPTLYAATHRSEGFKAAGYLSDYNPSGPLTIVLDQTPTTYSAIFDSDAISGSVTHHFTEAYISHSEVYPSSSIELFDNLPELHSMSFRAYQSRSDNYDNINVRVGRMQRHSVVSPYTSTVEVTLPTPNAPEQLLQTMLDWLNSDDTRYDLSSISDFETFTISLVATLNDGSDYQQNFYGPKRGSIPDSPLPIDYGVEPLLDETNISIYSSMLRYGDQQSYQQYLQSKTAASKQSSNDRLLGNRSKFNQIYVDIFL